jgi:hypothetical protein
MIAQKPTRVIETSDGVTTEYASLNSVELTNTAKDGWRVSSVKIYHNDPQEAAKIAVETAMFATEYASRLNQHNGAKE